MVYILSSLFLLEIARIAFVSTEPKPKENLDQYEPARSHFSQKWKNENKICRHAILNAMTRNLYNMYNKFGTMTKFWNNLVTKYIVENIRTKKYIVRTFLEFKMVETKSMISQLDDF